MSGGGKLMVHMDMDSPRKLLEFYQIKGVRFDEVALEKFYQASLERALDLFDSLGIKISFFAVGDEIENSATIQGLIRSAHRSGHEIENHTYSHPFGLTTLGEERIREEIAKCSEIILSTTGRKPVGFRAPGYSVNTFVINHVRQLGFAYDSSGFWSIMNPILGATYKMLFNVSPRNRGFGGVSRRLPQQPYSPSDQDWLLPGDKIGFVELPLPRITLCSLPFYHNFNLWLPSSYSTLVSNTIQRSALVYLFHMIEFVDMSDGLPRELGVHPNLRTPVATKEKQSRRVLMNLLKRHEAIKTEDFVMSPEVMNGNVGANR